MTFSEIDDKTGFAQGEPFSSADQVRVYFSPAEQRAMFNDDAITDTRALKEMAETVIRHGWHMVSKGETV